MTTFSALSAPRGHRTGTPRRASGVADRHGRSRYGSRHAIGGAA